MQMFELNILLNLFSITHKNLKTLSISCPGMRWYKGQSVPFMSVFNPDSQVRALLLLVQKSTEIFLSCF
jgi:hypothetical protein